MRYKLLLLFTLLLAGLNAQNLPEKPTLREGLVIDRNAVLSSEQERQLETKLQGYEDTTSTQIAIFITDRIEDDINLFAAELAHHWGIGGGEDTDNGCIIVVAIDDRQMSIQNGYGLEPYLTDATTKIIIDELIVPEFRKENYYEGLDLATTGIFQVIAGQFEGSGTRTPQRRIPILVILLVIALFIFLGSKGGRGMGAGRGAHRGYWIGGMGGGIGGGRGGGGFGGGGFGGFGGGGFGGGGASGSW